MRHSIGAAVTVVLALASGRAAIAEDNSPSGASEPQAARVTFRDAIARALARNPSALVARGEIQRAEALVREARAGSYPTLIANGAYTRLDADRKLQDRTLLSADQLSANVTLTVPLIVPQRWAQWSQASTGVDVARASADDTRRQVAIATARAYLSVISQKRVVDVNERALKAAKAHFDFAHTRLLGGLGNRIDDARAEQEMAADEAQVEATYSALFRAREALGVLLGEAGALDTVDDFGLPEPPSYAAAIAEATTNRSDIVASRRRLQLAEQVKKNSYTDYLPFLVGTVTPFYQNPASLTQPTTGWQAQLLLTIPIYDGGLRYGLSAERQALSAEARAQYEGLLTQARSDVRVAFESVKRAESAFAAATNAARLAKDALDLANLAYRAGATTNIEVIDAERRARDAETTAAVAEDVARQARVDLLSATGRFP